MNMERYQLPMVGRENFLKLAAIKRDVIITPDNQIALFVAEYSTEAERYYKEAFENPQVSQYLNISPSFNAQKSLEFINASTTDTRYHVYKTDCLMSPIGHVSIKEVNWDRLELEMGLVLKADFMGQKIAPKIVYSVLSQMKKIGFKQVTAKVDVNNIRSRRVCDKFFDDQGLLEDGVTQLFKCDLTQPIRFNPFQ